MEEQLLRELLSTFENGVSISTRSLILMLALVGFGSVLGSYLMTKVLSTKGQNLATKEDIRKITKITEEIRSQFHKLHEKQAQRDRLRLAALEQRLRAFQEAFSLWRQLCARCTHPRPQLVDPRRTLKPTGPVLFPRRHRKAAPELSH